MIRKTTKVVQFGSSSAAASQTENPTAVTSRGWVNCSPVRSAVVNAPPNAETMIELTA